MRLIKLATLLCLPALAFGQGFVEEPGQGNARGPMTKAQMEAFLPDRGRFTFPAPYGTTGWRLTNATDCGGKNCVNYVGYSYWRAINAHEGQDKLRVLVGLYKPTGGPGPSIVTLDKVTEQVSAPVPLFPASDGRAWQSTEQWYWSASDPEMLYYPYERGLYRVNATTGAGSTVVNVQEKLGGDYKVFQAHSSDDDKVHSFTLMTGSYARLGCAVYFEERDEIRRFDTKGGFDECQIDASGEWLVILENVDGQQGPDNRIINLVTGQEKLVTDPQGAGGHMDTGHGYMVAHDNYANDANTIRLHRFSDLSKTTVFQGGAWGRIVANHISHTNAKPGSPAGQYVCGSSQGAAGLYTNEIVCWLLDGSRRTLVVAPTMTSGTGGADSYGLWPKGNLDNTGRYFVWTGNAGGNRLDAFLVKVPGQLLTGGDPVDPDPVEPPPPPPDCPACPDCPTCPTCPPPVACPPPIVCPAPSPLDGLSKGDLNRLQRELRDFLTQTKADAARHERDAAAMQRILDAIDEARR